MEGKNTISLNKRFYDLAAVKEGAEDFKGICSIRIKENAGFINVEIKPKAGHNQSTINGEFLNYVLGLMKNKATV